MSHPVYTTNALVLRRAPSREADAIIWLLTEDFGLIPAVAQSVREERSKMRFSLQEFTHAKVSLVQGREIWRITGADIEKAYVEGTPQQTRELFGRIVSLVTRLVPGENIDANLFSICQEGFEAAKKDTDEDTLALLELVIVARILHALGYMPDRKEYRAIIAAENAYEKVINEVGAVQELLRNDVNAGLSESQL